MRIPFPERFQFSHAALFCVVLFLIQTLEGTALYFSAGCVIFILIATLAFNLGGGMRRCAGAYIFFYCMLVVIVGLCYKAYLGEPAESNLLDPKTDILVYIAGISGMAIAAFLSRFAARKTPLVHTWFGESATYRMSLGCMLFGFLGANLIALLGDQGARLNSAFTQLNSLIPLGIIIGVMYEIRRSGGTRSVNLSVLMFAAYGFWYYGLLGFSKQGMLFPIVCWLLPVVTLNYRLTRLQVISAVVGLLLIFKFFVPYAQYGKRYAGDLPTFGGRFALSMRMLENPKEVVDSYESDLDLGLPGYFNRPQGFWDRLTFISVDDGLVNVTDQGKVFGTSPILGTVLNTIPHVFWPNKPGINYGNMYAHEIGHMSEEDTTTGISFSATAEAYHMAKWVGVLVIAPIVWFILFAMYDSIFGDLGSTPWGLLVISLLAHTAPEGALTGLIGLMTFGTETFLFCAFFATYIAPVIASVAVGPERSVGPAYRRVSALPKPDRLAS